MGNLNLTFLPPQTWQDFEKFIKGVVDVIWKQEGWHSYGRPGQVQKGIDLFGYDEKGRFTAIQCKKKNLINSKGEILSNSLLTKKLIEKEIYLAENINDPKIERFIFATTSSSDTKIQDEIRTINDIRRKENKFLVEVWFWEDLQVYIEKHTELMYWYYSELLEKIHKYDKNIHVISLLKQAFTRPAFSREIRQEESGADFKEAIKNTMEAITTGKLYNRRGDLIASSFDYTILSNPIWKNKILNIYNRLAEIRKLYFEGIANNKIIQHKTCLEVLDENLSDQFNRLRTECLIEFNGILKETNFELIESELLTK